MDIKNNWVVKNLLLALLALVALLVTVTVSLSVITKHGQELVTPDFTNMTFSEASKVAQAAGVRVVVNDSVYVRRLRPGAVYMQEPPAGSMVKKGRRIRLTTNTTIPKEVDMPSLFGCSLRQAKAELLRNGLILGRIAYVRDIATNTVLRQQCMGADIAPGTTITSGTSINLILGLNPSDDRTFIPNLIGQKYLKAIDILQDNSLNVGILRFDSSVKTYADSINAVVYNQRPVRDSLSVRKGSEVSIYLRLEENQQD